MFYYSPRDAVSSESEKFCGYLSRTKQYQIGGQLQYLTEQSIWKISEASFLRKSVKPSWLMQYKCPIYQIIYTNKLLIHLFVAATIDSYENALLSQLSSNYWI